MSKKLQIRHRSVSLLTASIENIATGLLSQENERPADTGLSGELRAREQGRRRKKRAPLPRKTSLAGQLLPKPIHSVRLGISVFSSDGIDQRTRRLSLGIDHHLGRLLLTPRKLSNLRLLAFDLFYLGAWFVLGYRLFTEGKRIGTR